MEYIVMQYSNELDLFVRIIVSTILGGIIGLDRERGSHPAGFRTHILVCTGACLITIVSIQGFIPYANGQSDPARLAAQIVSGIGFLGAGTILHKGMSVSGLTTAASMWTVAGIGIASGVGMLILATATTILVRLILASYRLMNSIFKSKQNATLQISVVRSDWEIGSFNKLFNDMSVAMKSFDIIYSDENNIIIEFNISSKKADMDTVIKSLKKLNFVTGVNRIDQI